MGDFPNLDVCMGCGESTIGLVQQLIGFSLCLACSRESVGDTEIANSWGLSPEAQNTEWDYDSLEDKPENN
jgi:hypothetical protein